MPDRMTSLPQPFQGEKADWIEAAKQFGYPPDITPGDIRYWDGGAKLAKVLQRARELAHHREKSAGWQPIASAPKDGSRVLLFGPDGVDIGHWEPHWLPGAWLRQETAEYDNDGALISTPTHWQPLPSPPEQSA